MNTIRRVLRHPVVIVAVLLFAGFVSAGLTEWWLGADAFAWWGRAASVLSFLSWGLMPVRGARWDTRA